MDDKIIGIINIPGKGKRKEGDRLKRITRKDIKQSAIDLANSQNAQNYLNGFVQLSGNKSRQKLFDQYFQKEYGRLETEKLLKEAGLGGNEVVIDTGIKGDDAMKIAHTFRSRPLVGHIGGGRDQNLGDKDLLRIAPTAIGLTLGAANPITGTLIEPLAKPLVHTGKVLLDPTKAVTGVGEAAASTLDAYGAYEAFNANKHLINNWQNGQFHHSDIPKFALNTLGVIPGVKYFSDFVPAFGKAMSWAADDISRSYNDIVNGVEPALGIRANLPIPEEVSSWQNIRVPVSQNSTWSGTQFRNLDPQLQRIFRSSGLGQYDVQSLLDRGFSPEQIMRLSDVQTPGMTSNIRANELSQRLVNMGEIPTQQSRRQFLENAINNGERIVVNSYGRPLTISEANREGIRYSNMRDGWLDTYYPNYTNGEHPIYNDGSALPLFESLSDAIGVFDKSQLKDVIPQIQHVLEAGYDSNKSLDEIKIDLRNLFEKYGKPFIDAPIEVSHPNSPSTYAKANTPRNNFIQLLKNIEEFKSSPKVSLTKYTPETVSYEFEPNDIGYGFNDFHLFNIEGPDIKDWERDVYSKALHGSVTSEQSKSLQSSQIAHRQYANRARNGEGVIVFGQDKNGNPIFLNTNDLAFSTANPQITFTSDGLPKVNLPSFKGLLKGNIRKWETLLENTDPRSLKIFGDKYPTITANMGNDSFPITFSKDPKTGRVISSYSPDLDIRISSLDADNLAKRQSMISQNLIDAKSLDGKVLSNGDYIKVINDVPVLYTSSGPKIVNDDYYFSGDYDNLPYEDQITVDRLANIFYKMYKPTYNGLNLYQPLAGFRSFKQGGILKNLNKNVVKLLNV